MTTGKRTVAVVSPDGTAPQDVSGPLTRGGFAVRSYPLSVTAFPAEAAAVLVVVGDKPEMTAAFTRRCRAEAAFPRPVVWLIGAEAVHAAPSGFDAGADVCLVRPVDPDILLAQVHVLLRSYSELSLVATKGVDSVGVSERLGRLFRQTDTDAELARRTLTAFAPQPPVIAAGPEAKWVHVPSTRRGVNTLGVLPTGAGVRFALATAGGLATATGAALAESVVRFTLSSTDPPATTLNEVNRRVRELNLPDTAILSVTVGSLNSDGRAVLACGGHPPPVFVPADGPARLWHGVGPFLGQSAAGYSEIVGELQPGERLLLLGGGAAADKRPDVRAAADEQPKGTLSEFVRAVADAVFTPTDADDGYTLLAVGRPRS